MRRFHLFYVAPTLALLAFALWPLAAGRETLYTRDVLTSHYPMKASQAEAMRRVELPLVDPYRGGGQPLLGNPNALPLYPDNLLYLASSPLWALNAHFWLHLLVAPFAGFWLGRAWGLGRPAAWAVGVSYAASGFFLSLLNLYNLVAGAALAPAFIAACLDARGASAARRRSAVAAGLLWALLLVAGDPFFAALALALALSAAALRPAHPARNPPSIPPFLKGGRPHPPGNSGNSPSIPRSRILYLAAALACGTLLAAPMLVEFLRILPLSFRGYWQYSPGAALSQSWDPRSLAEWLLPFFFGRPDFTFWGQRFYGGNPPLFYSLYPGLPALALVLLAGRPRGRGWWRSHRGWAWGWVAIGLFFALGAWNPVVRLLYHLPGAAVLRFPVKFWLAVAIGAALLCGLGFERLVAAEVGGRRRLGWILGALGLLAAAAWWIFLRLPEPAGSWLKGLDPERLSAALFERQRLDWAWLACVSLAVLVLLGFVLRLARQRPAAGGALFLAIHLAAQLFLLQPLYDSDDASHYTRPPAALAAVPRDAIVVHGGHGDLFGKLAGSPLELFPDPRFSWLARAHFAQLYPFSGIPWGRRYAFNHSPEGLDSFFVISLARAVGKMPDAARLRVLEASGVGVLLLDRELDAAARQRVRLLAHYPASAPNPIDLYVYELPRAAAEVQMVATVLRAPHMNAALEMLTAPAFDPRSMVVLPAGSGVRPPGPGPEPGERPGGRVDVVTSGIEELEARVASEAGGVLVTQRAFLATWRAAVDGRPATPVVANLHRLAVEVPAGEHQVRLWIDRRPIRLAWVAAVLGLAGLAAIGWRGVRPIEARRAATVDGSGS